MRAQRYDLSFDQLHALSAREDPGISHTRVLVYGETIWLSVRGHEESFAPLTATLAWLYGGYALTER